MKWLLCYFLGIHEPWHFRAFNPGSTQVASCRHCGCTLYRRPDLRDGRWLPVEDL